MLHAVELYCPKQMPTIERSFHSFTLASIFARLNSLIGTFWTSPASGRRCARERKDQTFLDSVAASEQTQTLVPVAGRVGSMMERMLSTIALAALAALEAPRALMIAAPRCWHGAEEFDFEPRAMADDLGQRPRRSWCGEIGIHCAAVIAPDGEVRDLGDVDAGFFASWIRARFSSSRVMAWKCSRRDIGARCSWR